MWGGGSMIQKTFENGGAKTRQEVKIPTEPRSELITDHGWNYTTTKFVHTARNGGRPTTTTTTTPCLVSFQDIYEHAGVK